MKSCDDKLHMKIIALDEIYNYVVEIFFIWSHVVVQLIVWIFRHKWSKGVHMLLLP